MQIELFQQALVELDADPDLVNQMCQSERNIHRLYLSNIDPPITDWHLACPTLAGVAKGRPSAGD
ncbi:hypothetical protein Brsp05_04614 [Brucella sp. NBRC 12953]